MPQEARLAILFADISGSTALYDTLGDVRARDITARCIAVMTEAAHNHGGTLIKTIGDEVMTSFPDAEAAARAAIEMQDRITGQMIVEGRPLAIRTGFHLGAVLLEEDDLFGDAVNLAARMVNQAKSGQILTTGETVSRLSPELREACRQIDLAHIKGKREEIAIHELIWQAQDVTIMRAPWATRRQALGTMVFTDGATRLELGEGHPSLTVGRADQNDLVVRHPVTSRLHARIDYRNGRFVLTDMSANGTYVVQDDGAAAVYVHRESKELNGSGQLGLGEAVAPGAHAIVRFEPG